MNSAQPGPVVPVPHHRAHRVANKNGFFFLSVGFPWGGRGGREP